MNLAMGEDGWFVISVEVKRRMSNLKPIASTADVRLVELLGMCYVPSAKFSNALLTPTKMMAKTEAVLQLEWACFYFCFLS